MCTTRVGDSGNIVKNIGPLVTKFISNADTSGDWDTYCIATTQRVPRPKELGRGQASLPSTG